MNGITESATDDIFAHIKQHDDSVFVIKFSALEIYNEVASDLLNPESGPLRLMDDPERGTIILRLVEKVVEDKNHLRSLLDLCESHRQVGETALNDISSRSHQIIRLSIESSPRLMSDETPVKSLVAVLNFVDLAGSERASLSHSDGIRLKEGCYINRSLLTLSTVIRKLSVQDELNRGRVGHVPYRDSKLTRILQSSLGGNARTAIICTMSSSNRHVEQTRNTLFFALCAKEVTNRAQVNMVISDKELIKQLKREVALLEAKLRLSTFSLQSSSEAQLLEKDLQIQKMQEEMRLALQQRDLAQAQLNDVLKKVEVEQTRTLVLSKINAADSMLSSDRHTYISHSSDDSSNRGPNSFRYYENETKPQSLNDSARQPPEIVKMEIPEKQGTTASTVLLQEILKLEQVQKELAQDANRALEAVKKEVECLRLAQSGSNEEAAESVAELQTEISEIYGTQITGTLETDYTITKDLIVEESKKIISPNDQVHGRLENDKTRNGEFEDNNADLEKMLLNMHISMKELGLPMTTATDVPLSRLHINPNSIDSQRSSLDSNFQATELYLEGGLVFDVNTPPQAEENLRSVHAYVIELKEKLGKLEYQKQLLASRVLELEKNENLEEEPVLNLNISSSPDLWASEFSMKRKQIFELWHLCHVSLFHRTQFYLLFHGDPTDSIYIEVELRRLLWLKNNHQNATSRTIGLGRDEQIIANPASSMRILKRERQSLVKYMKIGLTVSEREKIYKQWDVPLDMKQRRVKVAYSIWTDPYNEEHIKMSASLVSKLVGLWNRHGPASKEMFQLSFSPPSNKKTWSGWNSVSNRLSFRK
ncbi:hypothetical protein KP509_31G009400 [Ceratopteris richardii]|nr:hypothetical protein KP509_31G009400 [Ceratopteris richardii]